MENTQRVRHDLATKETAAAAWQDEALARDGVSREVPCSALKCDTVPDSLPATHKSPPTCRVPPRGQKHTDCPKGSASTMILEPKKIKAVTVCIVSPSICHEMMGPGAMILVF